MNWYYKQGITILYNIKIFIIFLQIINFLIIGFERFKKTMTKSIK